MGYTELLLVAIPSVGVLLGCYSPDRIAGRGLDPGAGGGADEAPPDMPPTGSGGAASDRAVETGEDEASPGAGRAGKARPEAGSAGAGIPSGSGTEGAAGGEDADDQPATAEATRLPAACIGVPYLALLDGEESGDAPHTWRPISALPEGLQLDGDRGQISGIPVAIGQFTLEVVDAVGEAVARREFVLGERQTCWLAYLSSEDGATRLHFGAVFSNPALEISLPASPSSEESVADFRFAPNGAWIAFRLGTRSNYRLELYPTARDESGALASASTSVPFACPDGPCSVLEYAWSDDSRRLAVVLGGSTPERDYLSGVTVAEPEVSWPALGQYTFAGSELPFDHHHQLVWAGTEWVGLIGADPEPPGEPTETLYSAFVGEDGRSFERLVATGGTVGRGSLRAVPSGLVLANEGTNQVVYLTYGADLASPDDDVRRLQLGRASPSGLLVAQANGDARLQVRALGDITSAPIESDRGECSEVVAWSERVVAAGLERIACRAGEALNIFDYSDPPAQGASDPPPRLRVVARAEVPDALTGVRRAFSPSADWLVFGAPGGAYFTLDIARTNEDGLQLIHTDSSAELQFPAKRDVVAFLGVDALFQYTLPRSVASVRVYPSHGGAVAASQRCDELETTRWCGAPHVANHIKYSTDAQSLMFEGPAGVLWLGDMSAVPAPDSARELTSVLAPCTDDCTGDTYSFAP